MNDFDTIFAQQRRRIFGLCYRMLGSTADAEDIVQEVYLRWLQQRSDSVENPSGWLVTVAARLCIDMLRNARYQREHYVGVWLPEPLLEDIDNTDQGPHETLELAHSLTLAFLHLLERLTPVERAVLLLRQSFDWPFKDIAQTLGNSDTHCRQIFRRARQKAGADINMAPPDANAKQLMEAFLRACTSGDLSGLTQQLHQDVMAFSDGGGAARSLIRPISGNGRVLHYLLRVLRQRHNMQVSMHTINGEPGLVARENGKVSAVLVFAFREQKLWRIYSILNPAKLARLATRH